MVSDMEKEKQAFNGWYNGNTDDSWFFVNNVKSLDKTKPILFGFYGGYHSRDEEITCLCDVEERLSKSFAKTFARLTKKCAENEDLRAEIERKDESLKRVVDSFTPEIVHIGTMKTKYKAIYDVDSFDPIKQAKQALQNKDGE